MNRPLVTCWFLLAVVCAGACGKKTGSTPATSETIGLPAAADIHAGADLPAACDEYRRKLLRCMESGHFPKWAKEPQRSALEQMLSLARQEQRRTDDPGAGKAAAENCRASLATMVESGKESCPGVF